MQETSKYTVFNIREYLNNGSYGLGEDTLLQVLSEFSCEINPDVERFVKEQSVEFAKKQQSVTYLVFSTEDAELVGYFAITIKPITVNAKPFSNTVKRKLSRVSTLNEQDQTYNLAVYLIAQLGKNYNGGANEERLLDFYRENGFQQFDTRLTDFPKREPHELIQLLKLF